MFRQFLHLSAAIVVGIYIGTIWQLVSGVVSCVEESTPVVYVSEWSNSIERR